MTRGTSKSTVYQVEVRFNYPQPRQFGGLLLGRDWQTLETSIVPHGQGVPNNLWNAADQRGYLSYEAAEALRWWFHASAALGACLESRLIAFDYEESWSVERKAVSKIQEWPQRPSDDFEPIARDSDEHRNGEDRNGLSGEAMPARAEGIAKGQPS